MAGFSIFFLEGLPIGFAMVTGPTNYFLFFAKRLVHTATNAAQPAIKNNIFNLTITAAYNPIKDWQYAKYLLF